MSRGSRAKSSLDATEPTPGEQVAFLRGLAFAYRRAGETLRGAGDGLADAGQVDTILAEVENAAQIAEAAAGGSVTNELAD